MIYRASSSKKILSAFVLMSLLVIIFFSFATMMHVSDGRMQSNCPFTAMGTPLCPQELAAAAVHHISAYQSLLGAPQVPGMTALIIGLLLLAYGVLIFFIRPPSIQPQFARHISRSPNSFSHDRKTVRWLSLFENSPSFS